MPSILHTHILSVMPPTLHTHLCLKLLISEEQASEGLYPSNRAIICLDIGGTVRKVVALTVGSGVAEWQAANGGLQVKITRALLCGAKFCRNNRPFPYMVWLLLNSHR